MQIYKYYVNSMVLYGTCQMEENKCTLVKYGVRGAEAVWVTWRVERTEVPVWIPDGTEVALEAGEAEGAEVVWGAWQVGGAGQVEGAWQVGGAGQVGGAIGAGEAGEAGEAPGTGGLKGIWEEKKEQE